MNQQNVLNVDLAGFRWWIKTSGTNGLNIVDFEQEKNIVKRIGFWNQSAL